MNGKFPTPSDDDGDDNGLDPELVQLFEATARSEATAPDATATGTATSTAFVNSLLAKIKQERRLRLLRQMGGLAATLAIGAFLAPQVAQQTLCAAGWFTERLPATGGAFVSPLGYLCASLIAWRIARWARAH
jgi:hypothetical protein